MQKLISFILSLIFFVPFLLTSLIGNDENEQCTVLSALEFKTKKILEVPDNICEWNIVKTDLTIHRCRSEDDNFYLEFLGDDLFLERISISINNETIKIIEDPIIIKTQIITEKHPFFKTKESKGTTVTKNAVIRSKKFVINGYLLLEDNSFHKLPILNLYIPLKCYDFISRKILNEMKLNSNEIFNFFIKRLHNSLDASLTPELFDLAAKYVTQDLLILLEETTSTRPLSALAGEIIDEIQKKYQKLHEIEDLSLPATLPPLYISKSNLLELLLQDLQKKLNKI